MSWFFAFAAFAALIILHEYGHFIAAKSVGMQATRFSLFFPPAVFKFKPKKSDTSYEIGAIPLGGYVKITGMNPDEEGIPEEDLPKAYFMQPVWKRVVVIAAGPAMNFLIAFLLIFVLYAFVGVTTGSSTKVAAIAPSSAATGYVQPGDRLVAVNGEGGSAEKLIAELGRSRCAAAKPTNGCKATEPVSVTIERGGATTTFEAVPRYDASVKRMRLGVSFAPMTQTYSLPGSFSKSSAWMWNITKLTASLPSNLVHSQKRKQIFGTVGAYTYTEEAFKTSAETVLEIVALISLSLAIINLFPFLPLDGGHIFWALAEKVRGKRIPVAVLERSSIVGLAIIGMLFLVGLTNDIGRLTNGGFGH